MRERRDCVAIPLGPHPCKAQWHRKSCDNVFRGRSLSTAARCQTAPVVRLPGFPEAVLLRARFDVNWFRLCGYRGFPRLSFYERGSMHPSHVAQNARTNTGATANSSFELGSGLGPGKHRHSSSRNAAAICYRARSVERQSFLH